jgi:hypothetical protein
MEELKQQMVITMTDQKKDNKISKTGIDFNKTVEITCPKCEYVIKTRSTEK